MRDVTAMTDEQIDIEIERLTDEIRNIDEVRHGCRADWIDDRMTLLEAEQRRRAVLKGRPR